MALTIKYGANYKTAFVDTPRKMIHQGEYGGKERVCVDSITLDADAADQDTVKIGRLPAGAKVISARVFGPDLGATGTLKLGISASLDGSGDDAADDDAFIKAADSSGQAFDVGDGATAAMRGASIGLVRNTKECDITLLFNGATSGATGFKVVSIVKYIIE